MTLLRWALAGDFRVWDVRRELRPLAAHGRTEKVLAEAALVPGFQG